MRRKYSFIIRRFIYLFTTLYHYSATFRSKNNPVHRNAIYKITIPQIDLVDLPPQTVT